LSATVQSSLQPADTVTLGFGVRGEIWRSELRDDDAGPPSRFLILAPRASLAWRMRPDVSVRAAVHQAYRTPTLNELYRPFRVGNVNTLANVALDPEGSTGVEGALLARRGRAAMRVTAFWTRLTDPIVNVTLGSGPELILRQRQNAGRVRAAGIELEADARVSAILSLTAAAAYIDSTFTEGPGLEGLRVPQVPHWQASAGVLGTWPRASLSLDWRFIGSQFDDDRNQFLLDDSGMVNARAGWRIRTSLEVFAALENAFDQEQDVGRTPIRTIGLPRTARVGLRWSR
jgi:outer membrane receptor protein involved in Fe transport